MEKEKNVVDKIEAKRTSKWLVVLIIVIATIFTVLPIVGMVYAIFVFEDNIYTEFKQEDSGIISVNKDIKISNVEGFYNEEDDSYYVQGYLDNSSKNNLEFLYIEYLVYDKNDVLLGTAYCSVDNLKSNTKWKYKAIYSDIDSSEISRFELSRVEFY